MPHLHTVIHCVKKLSLQLSMCSEWTGTPGGLLLCTSSSCVHKHAHTHTHTYTHTRTHTHTHTHTHTRSHTLTHMGSQTQIYADTHKHSHTHTDLFITPGHRQVRNGSQRIKQQNGIYKFSR